MRCLSYYLLSIVNFGIPFVSLTLASYPFSDFHSSTWLWNIARGISGDEVEGRLLPKSHGCGKTFPGPKALKTVASVRTLPLENFINVFDVVTVLSTFYLQKKILMIK